MTLAARMERVRSSMTSGRIRGVLKVGWGFADQAVISLASILVTVLVARELTPREFGLFAVAQMLLSVVNAVQTALVTQPHNVLGAGLQKDRFSQLTSSLFIVQVVFSSLFVIALLGGTFLVAKIIQIDTTLVLLWGFTAVLWQWQDFYRRVYYTTGDQKTAFLNNTVSYGGQIAGLVLLINVNRLTVSTALLAAALGYLIASTLGFLGHQSHLFVGVSGSQRKEHIASMWQYGSWLLASTVVALTTTQLYPLFVTTSTDLVVAGVWRASQSILGPVRMLQQAMVTSYVTQASSTASSGTSEELTTFTRSLYLKRAYIALGYCGVVAVFSQQILSHVFGSQYSQFWWLLVGLASISALDYLAQPLLIVLNGLRVTSRIFRTRMIAACGLAVVGPAGVYVLGVGGLIVGLGFSSVVTLLLVYKDYRSVVR